MSYNCPAPSDVPGCTTSLPVETIATDGREKTRTVDAPTPAIAPTRPGVSTSPEATSVAPFRMSAPRRPMF
jgi:hypothetical protein